MKHLISTTCLIALLLVGAGSQAQNEGVSIRASGGAPHASAMLDVVSPIKGLLIPRVSLVATTNSSSPVSGPADGLLVFNTSTTMSTGRGFHYWDQPTSSWTRLTTGINLWSLIGSTNHIHYTAGNVRIGTSSTVSPTYNLEVINTAVSNTYVTRFAGPQGDLKFAFLDPVSQPSVGYASYLTQTSTLGGGSNYYSMIFSQVHGDGFKGIELITWIKNSSNTSLNWASINANKNKLYLTGQSDIYVCAGGSTGYIVTFDGTGMPTTSDSTLKKDISTMGSVLSNVMNLRPVTFKWKNDAQARTCDGFIAQEVYNYFPRLVTTVEVASNPLQPADGSVSRKMLNTNALIPILVKAIQEQQATIADLQSRVLYLETH